MLVFVFYDTVEITKQQFPEVHYQMSLLPLFFLRTCLQTRLFFIKHYKCIASALQVH